MNIHIKFQDNRTQFRDFGIFWGGSPPLRGEWGGGHFGKLKKPFVKLRGKEHVYQISRQSDGISRCGTLGGDSPPRGGTERNFKKMKKKASGYSYIEHVYQIS